MKAPHKAILIAAAVLAAFSGLLPVAAALAQPHEDPDAALWVFDGVSLLQKYSEALDMVVDRDHVGLDAMHEQALQANIPGDLRDSVDDFLASGQSLSDLIPAIRSGLETSRALLAQSRPEEAAKASASAGAQVIQAYTFFRRMETAVAEAGRWWKVDSAHPDLPLHRTYDEVLEKLTRLRTMLRLLDEVNQSATLQADVLSVIAAGALKDISPESTPEDILARLADVLAKRNVVSPDSISSLTPDMLPDILARLTGSLVGGANLASPTLTLSVSPRAAFVGEEVKFEGVLSANDGPLPGRRVTILFDGLFERVLETDETGSFAGLIRLPYHYVPTKTLQAIYFPVGLDLGSFLGGASPELAVGVLYYETTLVIEAPDRGYPGRDIAVKGTLDYGNSPVPAGRTILVYWDGEPAAGETVSTQFEVTLALAEDTLPGRHRVTVSAPAQGRYAPASAGADVQVTRLGGILDVGAQRVLLLPMSLGVNGRARSELGPLGGAAVTVRMGDWETNARTGADGAFEADLGTGLSLSLFGTQELLVVASPEEPWHDSASSALNVVVINPVNIGALVLAMIALLFFGVRWVQNRPAYVVESPATLPAPVIMETEPPAQRGLPALQETALGPRAKLLAVYREVLRLVQNVTAVALGPSRTLREFAQECGPRLGPLAGYFREMTLMVERMLYSRQGAGDAEAARSTELGRKLKEGLRREGD